MNEKPYKVMKWLRSIRDEHYKQIKDKSWQKDHQTISETAENTLKKILQIRNENLHQKKY